MVEPRRGHVYSSEANRSVQAPLGAQSGLSISLLKELRTIQNHAGYKHLAPDGAKKGEDLPRRPLAWESVNRLSNRFDL